MPWKIDAIMISPSFRAGWPGAALHEQMSILAGHRMHAANHFLSFPSSSLLRYFAEGHRLLHGDLELDNLRWDRGRPQVLDFDGAVYGPFALDIAIALTDVLHGPVAARDGRVSRFLDGYAEVRPPPAGTELLPRLASLVTAVKMADLLRAYVGLDDDIAPEWVRALHARHRRWLDVRRSGLEQLP